MCITGAQLYYEHRKNTTLIYLWIQDHLHRPGEQYLAQLRPLFYHLEDSSVFEASSYLRQLLSRLPITLKITHNNYIHFLNLQIVATTIIKEEEKNLTAWNIIFFCQPMLVLRSDTRQIPISRKRVNLLFFFFTYIFSAFQLKWK